MWLILKPSKDFEGLAIRASPDLPYISVTGEESFDEAMRQKSADHKSLDGKENLVVTTTISLETLLSSQPACPIFAHRDLRNDSDCR